MKRHALLLVWIGFMLVLASCGAHQKTSSASRASGSEEARKRSYYEKKYAIRLDSRSNLKLYSAVDKWIGVPHKLGACEKNGIDCSCLVNSLCREAYQCNTPRDTKGLYEYCKKIGKKELREGDIVFFQMKGEGKIDHVGLYLDQGKFVHASTRKGVMISSLDEPHFAKAYRDAGRVKCL